ncbi:MAG: carbamoyl-phosphate synthase large subunit [Candidatus Hydrothermarchaeota archaeon]
MPKREEVKNVLVIGSGPIIIGQAAEFDYSGSQACKSLREEGVRVILVNSNPATIMTDLEIADVVYIEPLTPEFLEKIIEKERPDGILPTVGGQTGLNIASELAERGILKKYGVETLGTPIEAIKACENRDLFKKTMERIGEPVPKSKAVNNLEDAKIIAEEIGFPLIIRPSYTLGGTGGGIAHNQKELEEIVKIGIEYSRINQVLIEEAVLGWKEFEYEVMRDSANNCITVCNMENIDPMGIHTGESIVVAPAQTLSDEDHQILRSASLRIIRTLGVEGGCNIQFAVHPETGEYRVIEVNPRVSRSSALASKATGYPIARVAAKIAIGMTLDEIPNAVTGETLASFEPTLDYVVIKIPRWPFDKFPYADRTLKTQMKSTGEVMAIGRTFEEALQKAVRSLDIGKFGLEANGTEESFGDKESLKKILSSPTDTTLFHIREALMKGLEVEEISRLTNIDPFFIHKISNIVRMEKIIKEKGIKNINKKILTEAKKLGFSDRQLAHLLKTNEFKIRNLRRELNIIPTYKMVDTCAAEFRAQTPYYYSSYESECEVNPSKNRKVIIIGAGPIRIGQGIEFDYCTVHAVLALREEGIEAIIINNNPETVSTDFDISDKLYFEPLTLEDVLNVIELEKPEGVMVQFGGQTSINLAVPLSKCGVKILGTSPESIDRAEDRKRFTELLDKLGIPQAPYGTAHSIEEAKNIARKIGYPLLVRPSYVLGGRAMEIVQDETELEKYMRDAIKVSPEHPVLVDKFLQDAVEVDVDAVCDSKDVFIGGIMEHIEQAGVHSGDSACVIPPQTLGKDIVEKIKDYTKRIALELGVVGLINIQYAVKDGVVYVLEANPRASRTVPYVSKAIGIPLAKLATKVMIGRSLKELGYTSEHDLTHVAVKEAVFSFAKLSGVDPVLGPEMKSTGEVMGIDYAFGNAFFKAQLGAFMELPVSTSFNKTIFISVKDEEQLNMVPIVKELSNLGFKILATRGTARVLNENGVKAEIVKKVSEGTPNILDYMRSNMIDFVINIPSVGREPSRDGFMIRRACVELSIPYITTLAGARAAVEAIKKVRKGKLCVRSLSEYYRGKWKVEA